MNTPFTMCLTQFEARLSLHAQLVSFGGNVPAPTSTLVCIANLIAKLHAMVKAKMAAIKVVATKAASEHQEEQIVF